MLSPVLTRSCSVERREEVVLDPLADELVAGAKAEHAVGEPVELHAGEPLVEARRRLVAREGDGLSPSPIPFAGHTDSSCDGRRHRRATLLMALHPRLHRFPRKTFDVVHHEPLTCPMKTTSFPQGVENIGTPPSTEKNRVEIFPNRRLVVSPVPATGEPLAPLRSSSVEPSRRCFPAIPNPPKQALDLPSVAPTCLPIPVSL